MRADTHGWLHPSNEAELTALIVRTRAAGRRLRVRGAGHSVPAAIAGRGDTVVVLDRLRGMSLDEASGEVSAGAGLRFGADPFDPRVADGVALCPWLHERGRALPNLGGVLHQTVAGFLLTGSGGGSTQHDLASAVAGLRLIDGTGKVRDLRRGRDDDLLDAVLVSLGALGIVTEVTFRTVPAYELAGTETVLPDRGPRLDLFADGPTGLEALLRALPYGRVLWWPQAGARRAVVWEAHPVSDDDPAPSKVYAPMPTVFGSTLPMQAAAGAALWGLTHWRDGAVRLGRRLSGRLERAAPAVEQSLYGSFVDGDPGRPQHFRGPWWQVLPQDAQMDERLMPTTFTEVFVPLAQAGEAMRRLEALFETRGAHYFCLELYAAPASRAWLHPAFERESLRINVFWLTHVRCDPRTDFFPALWAALAPLEPRLHWGKLFPYQPAKAVVGRFSRQTDFLALRRQLDPSEVFLTDWLRAALEAAGARLQPHAPLPGARMGPAQRRWPLVVGLEPAGLELLETADHIFDLEAAVAASPEDAIATLFNGSLGSKVPGLLGFTWHTPEGELQDAVVDEAFVFMTLRLRTVVWEPGRRLAMSVDRCSLPLGRSMLQVVDATPAPGGCRVRWRIAVRFLPLMAPAAPLLLPAFGKLFDSTLAALVAHHAGRRP